jgi:hypothetical protein
MQVPIVKPTAKRNQLQYSTPAAHRMHLTRLKNIDTHEFADAADSQTVVSSCQTKFDALRIARIDSTIRQNRALPEPTANYLWSREAIDSAQEATMMESVDIYLDNLIHGQPAYISPRPVPAAEIPDNDFAGMPRVVPRPPRKLARAFDCSGFYDPQAHPLLVTLPELEITRKFADFCTTSSPKMVRILDESGVLHMSRPQSPVPSGRSRPR